MYHDGELDTQEAGGGWDSSANPLLRDRVVDSMRSRGHRGSERRSRGGFVSAILMFNLYLGYLGMIEPTDLKTYI